MRHVTQQAEDFIRLARGQHRGRFVQDQESLIKIKELQDFELLFLAGRHRRDRLVERHAKRHPVKESFERLHLLAPFDDRRRVGPTDDEIFCRGQGGNQREVLVHHADAERLRVARIADGDLLAVQQELPAVGRIEPHDAFDERRLAGAVLAEQRMEGTAGTLIETSCKRFERAERLRHADRFERRRAGGMFVSVTAAPQ